MLNIGITSIKRAKKVLSEGTPEEIAAVEAGKAAGSTIAKKIKQREKETAGT